jgi:glycosyltransferase involved in cell wall biosynthesis
MGSFHRTPVPGRLAPLAAAIAESDVVHILGYRDPLGTAAATLAQFSRVPYVVEPVGMHRRRIRSLGLKSAYDRVLGRRLISKAAFVVATSRLEASELAEDSVPMDRIQLRPNGVDVEDFLPLPPRGTLRGRAGVSADAPLILALGRIARGKGLLDMARALAALDGVCGVVAGPDAGDGTLYALLELRRRLGLRSRLVVIPKGLWGEEKAQAFADADVFCLPSVSENFGNAAAEAAACGLPVVLSDRCGVAEWLDPRATVVVPYGVPSALVQALEVALREPMARAGEQVAGALAQALSWRDLARRQLEIYQSLGATVDLGAPPGRTAGQAPHEPPRQGETAPSTTALKAKQ